jgi:ABC-type Mn2+/Zn2+ transport system permease subunit
LAAAILTNFGGSRGRLSREALTGWVFLASSSFALLLLFHTPIGLKEIQERLSSSIIGASDGEIILFGGLFLVTLVTMIITRYSWMLLAMDPPTAAAVGLRTRRWEFVWAVWLGLVVGLAIRSSGTIYTFGCLVLPPLIANQLCREVGQLVILSPVLGFAVSVFGFIFANYYDFPPAQTTIALLSIVLLSAWIARRLFNFLP